MSAYYASLNRTGSTGLLGFELRIAPDKKHALLFYSRSKMDQICWIHLPDGKPPANWIEEDKLENLALTACGKVDSGWVAKHKFWFLVDFLDWDAQGRCRLKWEYSVSHEGSDDTTNTGIAIVTEGRNGEPSVSIDSFLKDLTDDQMKNVRYGKHVTLKR